MTMPADTLGTSVPAADTTAMSKDLAAPAYLLQKRRISKQRKQPGYDRPQTDQNH